VARALTTAAAEPAAAPDPAGAGEAVIRAVPRSLDLQVRDGVPVMRPAGVPAPPAPVPAASLPPTPEEPARVAPRRKRGTGARERRRLETRERIVDAATDLFAERGFDAVSVMEIARTAGVVEKTVFNHFPVKEGLVFEADLPIRAALLAAVRRRPAGESVSAAAGHFIVAAVALLGSPEAAEGAARLARVIRGSRTLQAREREILGELTDALAGLIREETGAAADRLDAWLAAHAVVGLYGALLDLARDRVLAGVTGPALAAELRESGRQGLALLQFGLAGYAKRQGGVRPAVR
jgi:AcrR family transcriptional regulator